MLKQKQLGSNNDIVQPACWLFSSKAILYVSNIANLIFDCQNLLF